MKDEKLTRSGFTLVELSIVLVIIGLLIGGILIGQSMIESAKMNKFIGQIQQYDAAVKTFHLKFKAIPGDSDMIYESQAPSTCTVDSDKDGLINNANCANNAWGNSNNAATLDEIRIFWYDLAKMVDIKIPNCPTLKDKSPLGSTRQPTLSGAGCNWVKAALGENVTLFAAGKNRSGYSGNVYRGRSDGNAFYTLDCSTTNNYFPSGCTLPYTQSQAIAYDQKIDDGVSNSGTVHSSIGLGFTRSWSNTLSAYDTSSTQQVQLVISFSNGL